MRRWWRGFGATVLAIGLVAGCAGAAGQRGGAADAAAPNDAAPDQFFYVSDQTPAAKALPSLSGADAAALTKITSRPAAAWLGDTDARAAADRITRAATAAGRAALLVAYDIPNRDCGQYSAGGAADAGAYRAWVDGLAAGIGDRTAWVILEPDAIAHVLDGCGGKAPAAAERYDLLSYAVGQLKKQPRTRVYLDAGNAGWISDVGALSDALKRSGVDRADGFALNVANFHTTDRTEAFGADLSAALGGKHFVVDTSRNGNGPAGPGQWCNPPGRKLGLPPSVDTARAGVDAYLWVKSPGESDGDCGRGEPRAGEFWLEYALALAR